MPRAGLELAIVLLGLPSVARATTVCTYLTSYNDPYLHGPCFVDAVDGCPVHLVLPHTSPPVELAPIVLRDGQRIDVTATASVVGTLDATIPSIDYYSCDCHRETGTRTFDELAVTLTGTREGDVVSLGEGERIEIAPAADCVPPTWPTEIEVQLGGCDPCPVDAQSEMSGCAAAAPAGYASPAVLVLAIGLARRRRRSGRDIG
ncbi:MAG TPA: hypothetical protein VFK02_00085 [Kofleriaceae bacterium]|nr:hypothetical protein [Kofleriaceae bacterium]